MFRSVLVLQESSRGGLLFSEASSFQFFHPDRLREVYAESGRRVPTTVGRTVAVAMLVADVDGTAGALPTRAANFKRRLVCSELPP